MKSKSLFKISVIAVCTALIFTACKKKDDDATPVSTSSFSCKIDGVTFKSSKFNNTLLGDGSGKRLDIRATDGSGKQFIVSVGDGNDVGSTFEILNDTIFVDVFENDPNIVSTLGTLIFPDNTTAMSIGDGKAAGYVILTKYDLSAKKASGVFEYVLENLQTGDSLIVTEGKFTNVSFTVFQ